MKRRRISDALERQLTKFYGGKRCVVTGVTEDTGVAIDWAHLDEDRSNTTFDNVVPLSSGFNRIQQTWTNHKERGID
jgi:hypothetical protein